MIPWSHSMGTRPAVRAMRDIRAFSPATHTIVQPFCGIGTALVIANRHGFHTVGVEWNRRRAEQARTLTMDDIRAADAERLAMRERRGPRHKRG
jgi:predicted TIM-barrel enzyme